MLNRRNMSFSALRAFEATAKYLNMGEAAAELGITHAAVSHQVRLLESRLEVRLFSRSGKRLAMTTAGYRFKEAVSEGIDTIIDGARYLDPADMDGQLTIGCTQSIASSWAARHIVEFSQAYPTIQIVVREIPPAQRQLPRDIDVAICYGEPEAKGRRLVKLGKPDLYPVCSPSLLTGIGHAIRVKDISKFTLIHDGQVIWRSWLEKNNVPLESIKSNIYFPNASQALRAAILGGGVALSNQLESRDFIREGQLIKLFDVPNPEERSYWLLCPNEQNHTMKTAMFEDWIIKACNL